MRTALKGVPETVRIQPESVVERDGLYYYRDPVKGGAAFSGDLDARDLVRDQIF